MIKKECYFCGTKVEYKDVAGPNTCERMECIEGCKVIYITDFMARECYFEKKPPVLTKEDKDVLFRYVKARFDPKGKIPILTGEIIHRLIGK